MGLVFIGNAENTFVDLPDGAAGQGSLSQTLIAGFPNEG
jgi:hypothetical protein